MRIGSLVRPHTSRDPTKTKYLDRLAIVVVKGTWSVDIKFIDSNSSSSIRFAKEDLEVICE